MSADGRLDGEAVERVLAAAGHRRAPGRRFRPGSPLARSRCCGCSRSA